MAYLRFFQPTRQGEAAHDVDHKFETVSEPLFKTGCGNGWATSSMAGNPGMVGQGNFGNSPEGGCGIDTQTRLLWGDPGTSRQAGPKQVFPRPWATTPNLGLGSVESIPDQNKVVFGHSTANRKSIQTVTDKQFPVFVPLIPELLSDFAEYGSNLTKVVANGGYGYNSSLDKKGNRVDLSS